MSEGGENSNTHEDRSQAEAVMENNGHHVIGQDQKVEETQPERMRPVLKVSNLKILIMPSLVVFLKSNIF